MDVLEFAAQRAAAYLDEIRERRVAPSPAAVDRLSHLDQPLPEDSTDPLSVLRELDEIGSPATLGTAGPRFFGWVIGGALPVTVGASWLANAWDQCAGLWVASPTGSALEEIALKWMIDLFGLPGTTEGAFATGATMANFTAIAAARYAVLKRAGWDVESQGLFGAPEITVVGGEEVHPSVIKALGLAGLGRDRVIRVPVDDQGRMRAEHFPALSKPSIVCIQAGNVNTGAFDPLREIVARAHQAGAWVHVDGAFGMWAAASPKFRHLADGIGQADSWATDAHKWLNVPYDSGLAFVREREPLRAAMAVTAAYLPPTDERRDPSNFTPELSRRARGVEVWAALRFLGRRGLIEMIERTCRLARRFAEGLREAGFEILNEVVLNQVLVSFGEPEKTRRVIQKIQEDGTCWAGVTLWQGRTAMRISVCSWATTEADVERSLEVMIRIASSLSPTGRGSRAKRAG